MWLEAVEGGLVHVSWAELYARILVLLLVGNVSLGSRGLFCCPLNNVGDMREEGISGKHLHG